MTSERVRAVTGVAVIAALGVSLGAPGAAWGQFLLDGDMEGLAIGTAPDCDQPAGAWEFPENYLAAGLCESRAEDFRIESEPSGRGKSLLLKIGDGRSEAHLTNRFTQVFEEGEETIFVVFDIFVASGGGGGVVYLAGDHGGGGYGEETDRGPQLMWDSSGQLVAFDPEPTVYTKFEFDRWQRVELMIDLRSDTFELFHTNDISTAPELVAQDLRFRSGQLERLDRFSIAHIGALEPLNVAFFDNVDVGLIVCSCCYADCDESGELDFFDFLCFQDHYALGTPYADCDGSGQLDFFDFLCFQDAFATGCP